MSSSVELPNPALMIGWLPQNGRGDPNRGLYVLENPTPAQLQVFESANFPFKENPFFAPPELMKEAGADRYIHIYDCPAVMGWVRRGSNEDSEEEPQILISMMKNRGGYIQRAPTKEQCNVFKEAGFPYKKGALGAMPPDLMKKAGATFYEDLNKVPEYVALTYSLPSDEWHYKKIMETAIWGSPKTGGMWVLEKPSREQLQVLIDGGYEFWNYDSEDKYHGLLEKAGAKFYENPEDALRIIDPLNPGGRDPKIKDGERGGRVRKAS